MRSLAAILLLCLTAGCAIQPGEKLSALNGIWIPARQELGGATLPAAAFKNSSLTLVDGAYTTVAESVDKGVFTVGDGKMDIYGKDGVNAGKHYMAIYQLNGDELTICYNLDGDGYPAAFATKGKPKYFLSVFQKKPGAGN